MNLEQYSEELERAKRGLDKDACRVIDSVRWVAQFYISNDTWDEGELVEKLRLILKKRLENIGVII